MATRPEEVPFDEPSGQPPMEPSPFLDPCPEERPAGPSEPSPDPCPVEVPEQDVERSTWTPAFDPKRTLKYATLAQPLGLHRP